MASPPFARTKIEPPQFRHALIERPALERRLRAALLEQRLVLLVAPAGYGKTAALAREFHRLPSDCAAVWVTLDADDRLPRLVDCLSEALEPWDPPWRVAPEALVEQAAKAEGLRGVCNEFINALAAIAVRQGVIALDDLHRVEDPAVHRFLGLLLDGLPELWSLAIASRAVPDLALGRLRVAHGLAEFGLEALCFDKEEIRRLCSAHGEADDSETVDSLYARTQGWAAGLNLSIGALARRSPLAGAKLGQRHMFEYLAAEVLDDMPAELREFLLRCSVLPELTAKRCAAVSGNPRAADLLDQLESRGLFVSVLVGEEFTLRLHDLFRDFLRDRLRHRPDHATLLPQLLRRAAEGETDPLRQVHMLIAAEAWDEAEEAFGAAAAPMLLASGQGTQLTDLIEAFPADMRESSPVLCFILGQVAWTRYGFVTMQSAMHRAAAGFDARGRHDQAQQARVLEAIGLFLLGRMREGRALIAQVRSRPMDQETTALNHLSAAWESTVFEPASGPEQHIRALANVLTHAHSPGLWLRCIPALYPFIGRVGARVPMDRLAFEAQRFAGEDHPALLAAAKLLYAWLWMWRGDLSKLHWLIGQIAELDQWLGRSRRIQVPLDWLRCAYFTLRGDLAQARKAFAALAAEPGLAPGQPHRTKTYLLVVGRLAAALDDPLTVRQTLEALDAVQVTRELPAWRAAEQALRATVALEEGRDHDALDMLREAAIAPDVFDVFALDAFTRVHLALALLRTGSPDDACEVLEPLLMLADSGDVGGILLCGPKALHGLAQGARRGHLPAESTAVLAHWATLADQLRTGGEDAAAAAAAAVDPREEAAHALSARELEVLALIAEGASNKLIARTLELSPHTVKRHVARILGRLALSSRGQAAAWYRRNHTTA